MAMRDRAAAAPAPRHASQPEVEFIRDWFTPAFRRWSRVMYGGRGYFVLWGGCLFWFIVLPFVVLKAAIFWSVAVVMLLAFFCTAMYDVLTIRRRLKAA